MAGKRGNGNARPVSDLAVDVLDPLLRKRAGLTILDHDDGAVSVLIEFADDADIGAAIEHGHRFRVGQSGNQRFGWRREQRGRRNGGKKGDYEGEAIHGEAPEQWSVGG